MVDISLSLTRSGVHRERDDENSHQVPVDRICCYPRVSLSGSSFLSSTLFTLFTEVGCRDKGDSGTEPRHYKNGALCANCCPSGTTAVQFMQVLLIFL